MAAAFIEKGKGRLEVLTDGFFLRFLDIQCPISTGHYSFYSFQIKQLY
jgi:ribosomal protein L24E